MIRRPPSSTLFPSTPLFRSVINDDRRGLHWGKDPLTGSGWHDSTKDAYPDWIEVAFAGERSISEVHVFSRSEEHTSELQSRQYLVCRLVLEKKNAHTLLEIA